MAELTLQWVFQQGYAAFALGHRLPAYVQQAVWALLACRTACGGRRCARSAAPPIPNAVPCVGVGSSGAV